MYVIEVVKFFTSMGPDHKCVIHVAEPTCGFEGHPVEHHILKVFQEVGNDK
jgi:hypothetical protein